MEGIYLDNNATTRVDPAVVEAMLPYFTEQFGNPSSMHSFGNKVGLAIKKARMQVQELLGAEHDSEIIFTSCGTESDSTAIISALKAQPDRNEIITTTVEHPAILTLCTHLEKEGYKVHLLKVDGKGRLDLNEYKKLLTDQVAVVSVMWANNETGTFFPVVEMAELANAAGAMFHTDAVQAVGKVPLNLKETKIDMLSLSGHKLHAPKGIGVLYLKRGTRFRPLLRGGHQERGRRAGTENTRLDRRPGQGRRDGAGSDGLREHRSEAPARQAGSRHPGQSAARLRDRRPEQPPAQHQQHRVRVHRGRGDPAAAEQVRHCRQLGLGLHFRLAGTVARDAGDGHSLHRRARHGALLAVALQHRGGSGSRDRRWCREIIAQLRKLSPYWEGDGPAAEPEKAFAPTYA